jgi:hypothetical protein
MEDFGIRLMIVGILLSVIIFLKLISVRNKQKSANRQQLNRDLLPMWQPGKESIMFFTNDSCMECEKLQKPAINRLKRRSTQIFTINAAEDLTLANYYRILTVPTTIILDNQGVPQFINQGYTNEKILSEQLGRI